MSDNSLQAIAGRIQETFNKSISIVYGGNGAYFVRIVDPLGVYELRQMIKDLQTKAERG